MKIVCEGTASNPHYQCEHNASSVGALSEVLSCKGAPLIYYRIQLRQFVNTVENCEQLKKLDLSHYTISHEDKTLYFNMKIDRKLANRIDNNYRVSFLNDRGLLTTAFSITLEDLAKKLKNSTEILSIGRVCSIENYYIASVHLTEDDWIQIDKAMDTIK